MHCNHCTASTTFPMVTYSGTIYDCLLEIMHSNAIISYWKGCRIMQACAGATHFTVRSNIFVRDRIHLDLHIAYSCDPACPRDVAAQSNADLHSPACFAASCLQLHESMNSCSQACSQHTAHWDVFRQNTFPIPHPWGFRQICAYMLSSIHNHETTCSCRGDHSQGIM